MTSQKPQLRVHVSPSIKKDAVTLRQFRDLEVPGKGLQRECPDSLIPEERDAFVIVESDNIMLEQEKLPISESAATLRRAMLAHATNATNPPKPAT